MRLNDPDLSQYKGVSGNVYRVVKQTLQDKSIRYEIQLQICMLTDNWVRLTERSNFETAMEAINFLVGKTVIKEEVVWYDYS